MKLHEIETEIKSLGARLEEWAETHNGDITDFPLVSDMEALEIERERKLLSMACLVKDLEAESESLLKEAASLRERSKVKHNAAARIKGVISAYMNPGEKLEDNRAVLAWRTYHSVEVDVPAEKLPEHLRRTEILVEPDKVAIKDALRSGEAVEGCRLVTKQNLQIK